MSAIHWEKKITGATNTWKKEEKEEKYKGIYVSVCMVLWSSPRVISLWDFSIYLFPILNTSPCLLLVERNLPRSLWHFSQSLRRAEEKPTHTYTLGGERKKIKGKRTAGVLYSSVENFSKNEKKKKKSVRCTRVGEMKDFLSFSQPGVVPIRTLGSWPVGKYNPLYM